jgi:hypothetical protein
MASPQTPKPATARHGEPASNVERFQGELKLSNTQESMRAQRLAARFGFAFETAIVISALAWGIAR